MSSSSVKEKFQVSPFFVFFLVNANQVGVGILNFQTNLVRSMNNDGWIAILISGFSVNVMIFLMYMMFKKAPSDEEASEEYPDTIINLSYPGKDLPPGP